jgi:branched-chain amino acid transport system permease protein
MVSLLCLACYISILPVTFAIIIISIIAYKLVISKTMGRTDLPQIFATLGIGIVMQNLAYLFWSGNYRTVTTAYTYANITIGDLVINVSRLLVFITAMFITWALFIFLKYTTLGKAIRAVVQNETAASIIGINVPQIYLLTFAIGTGLAGVAGCGIMAIYAVYPMVGFDIILVAFVICVLGGIGSIPGAIVGSLIIAFTETLTGFFIAESMKQVVYFIIFVAILIIRPNGILGRKGEAFLHR